MRPRCRRAWSELPAAALAIAAAIAPVPSMAQAPAPAPLPSPSPSPEQPAPSDHLETPSWPLVVQRAPEAADCPDATALAARVEKLSGRRALAPAPSSGDGFAFEVQILKSDDGYTAIVLAAGKSRQIADPGPACESLASALALTLAILLDTSDVAPVPPPPPPPPPLPRPAPPPILPPIAPPPPPYVGPRLLVAPFVGVTEGLAGSVVPAVTAAVDVRVWSPLSILAGFTWMPSQDFPLSPGRVEVQLLYGQIAACLSTWRFLGRSRVGGCLQVNAGSLRGKGVDFPDNREVVRPWVSLGPTGLLDVAIVGPLYVSARFSVFATPTQEAFEVDDIGVAFDPSPVGVLAGMGVGVRIF